MLENRGGKTASSPHLKMQKYKIHDFQASMEAKEERVEMKKESMEHDCQTRFSGWSSGPRSTAHFLKSLRLLDATCQTQVSAHMYHEPTREMKATGHP